MGVKISALPSVSVPALTDVFPIVQAGVTYKETVTQLSALIGGVVSGSIIGTANQITVTPGVGNVTLSTPQDIATTSNVTFNSLAFSDTTKGLLGTTTNNSASTGYVGEFVTSSVNAVAIASNVVTNITSIPLTAGDWDAWGNFATIPAGGTTTAQIAVGVTTISATFDSAYAAVSAAFSGDGQALAAPTKRISITAPTTVYLAVGVTYAVSTLTVAGTLSARRAR